MARIFYITDIVEVDLDTCILYPSPLIGLGIISNTDKAIGIVWMEVCRVTRNLEFAEDSWLRRVRERDDEEWINLLECDEIETISNES